MHRCNINWSIWTLPGVVVGWPHSNCFLSCRWCSAEIMNVNNSINGLLYWEVCRSFLISNLRPRLCLSGSQFPELSDGVANVSSLVVMCGAGCQLCSYALDTVLNAAAIPIRSTVAAVFGDVPLLFPSIPCDWSKHFVGVKFKTIKY